MKFKLVSKHRRLFIFFILILVALASSQTLRSWVRSGLSPIVRQVSQWGEGLQGAWRNYVALVGTAKENQELLHRLQALEGELARLRESSRSSQIQTNPSHPGIEARVLAQDPHSLMRAVTINRGLHHGVRVGDVALVDQQLVGRVVQSSGSSAQVMLLTDPRLQISVIAQGTRAKGVLSGKRQELSLDREIYLTQGEYFDGKAEIVPGEILMTSGLDGLFPQGIPVGRVRSVASDANGLFQRAEVETLVEPQKLERIWIQAHDTSS